MTEQEAKALGDRLGVNWKEVDLHQFQQGLVVEAEHKDVTHGDPDMTARIALAHLKERPDYYSRLQKVEGGVVQQDKPKKGWWGRHFGSEEEAEEPPDEEYPRSTHEGSTKAMIRKLRREGRI